MIAGPTPPGRRSGSEGPGRYLVASLLVVALVPEATAQPAETAGPPATDAPAGEVITVTEAEAQACAAKLEPMVATFEDPTDAMYLRQLGEGIVQVWAPREAGPNAPFRPWCVTTVHAIADIAFLNPANRGVVMDIVAASGPEPPPQRDAPEAVPSPPPTVIVKEEEDPAERPLPAAFQRLPPKGGRSTAEVGVPMPAVLLSSPALPASLGAAVTGCQEDGGQVTAVYDRLTGALLRSECRKPDDTATPLGPLAELLGGIDSATMARDR